MSADIWCWHSSACMSCYYCTNGSPTLCISQTAPCRLLASHLLGKMRGVCKDLSACDMMHLACQHVNACSRMLSAVNPKRVSVQIGNFIGTLMTGCTACTSIMQPHALPCTVFYRLKHEAAFFLVLLASLLSQTGRHRHMSEAVFTVMIHACKAHDCACALVVNCYVAIFLLHPNVG